LRHRCGLRFATLCPTGLATDWKRCARCRGRSCPWRRLERSPTHLVRARCGSFMGTNRLPSDWSCISTHDSEDSSLVKCIASAVGPPGEQLRKTWPEGRGLKFLECPPDSARICNGVRCDKSSNVWTSRDSDPNGSSPHPKNEEDMASPA